MNWNSYPFVFILLGFGFLQNHNCACALQFENVAQRRLESGHSHGVEDVTYSADGKYLATISGDDTIKLWNPKNGNLIRTIISEPSSAVVFSPDGSEVAACGGGYLAVFDVQSGIELKRFSPSKKADPKFSHMFDVAYSPEGDRIFGAIDSSIVVWERESGKELAVLTVATLHNGWVGAIDISPDGRLLASGSRYKGVSLWDASKLELICEFCKYDEPVNCVRFSPDGKSIAIATERTHLSVWDVGKQQRIQDFTSHANLELDWVSSIAFSPDGTRICGSSTGLRSTIWDVESGRKLLELADDEWTRAVSFSPDGGQIATGGRDRSLRAALWDSETGKLQKNLLGQHSQFNSAVFSPDGASVLTSSFDGKVILWDSDSREPLRSFRGHDRWVSSAVFSPDGKKIISASDDKTSMIWNADTGKVLQTLGQHHWRWDSAIFNHDGSLVATFVYDEIKIWDPATGGLDRTLRLDDEWADQLTGSVGHIKDIAFSPYNNMLLAGVEYGRLALWDERNPTPTMVHQIVNPRRHVKALALSSDGNLVLAGISDHTSILCDANTGEVLQTFHGHKDIVTAVAFVDVDRVVTVSGNTAIIWDVQSGKQAHVLQGHQGTINSVDVSPDGRRILTASSDTTVAIWHAETGKVIGIIGN